MNKQKEKTPIAEQDPKVRATNFDEVSLGYTADEAVNEAQRCIHCKNQPCVSGCPVGVFIPYFIKAVAEGDFARGFARVKATNALPAICGRVCPQENQCEGQCTRGRNGEPVGIGRLERFVADWAAENPEAAAAAIAEERKEVAAQAQVAAAQDDAAPAAPVDLTGKKAAMIGSGPSSLTCAGELAKHGVAVTVFEALHAPGGVLTYGIPEFRLPKSLVASEIGTIAANGVDFQMNSVIGKLYSVEELMNDMGFDAIFVGTGAGLPGYLGIEGEGLNGVSVANELLTRVNLMKAYKFPEYATPVYVGKHCVVVGGGNVAMDAARTAKRLGADVTIVYRRSRQEMPARTEEAMHAEQEGITFQMLTNPVRAIGDEKGWVQKLECQRMELGEPDASGRRRPVAVEGSEFTMDCDMFIIAVGSKTNPLIAQTTEGLDSTSRNLIVADDETCATSVPGVFAGGDAVSGAATVILAMGAGKRAAAGIVDYLSE